MLLDRREIELKDGSFYVFDVANGMEMAWDCQKESGQDTKLRFDSSKDNVVTLMLKRKASPPNGCLVLKEETIVPELEYSSVENHSTWLLSAQRDKTAAAEEEDQYEAVEVNRADNGGVAEMVSKNRESSEEVELASNPVPYEEQPTLKIRRTPSPPAGNHEQKETASASRVETVEIVAEKKGNDNKMLELQIKC
jgi:hypothetical protein